MGLYELSSKRKAIHISPYPKGWESIYVPIQSDWGLFMSLSRRIGAIEILIPKDKDLYKCPSKRMRVYISPYPKGQSKRAVVDISPHPKGDGII